MVDTDRYARIAARRHLTESEIRELLDGWQEAEAVLGQRLGGRGAEGLGAEGSTAAGRRRALEANAAAVGMHPDDMVFSNLLERQARLRAAYRRGVRHFAGNPRRAMRSVVQAERSLQGYIESLPRRAGV